MGKRFIVLESEKNNIRQLYLGEQEKQDRKFCHSGNVKSLEEIMGDDEPEEYVQGVKLRKNGICGLTDKLELLKTMRLIPAISDGGEHLAYEIMNTMKGYKPYNFFDDARRECMNAMDKIIELYKENEHGEELVKDIEKAMGHHHISQQAREYLKRGLEYVRGK